MNENLSDLEIVTNRIYENAINRPNGTEWGFYGWKFVKVDATLSPNHSEVKLLNPEGNKVESYTIEAYGSYDRFYDHVVELIDYNPESLQDWLDHRREMRNNE